MRVVSLLPSATEILCAIGGRRLLVGRSHECDWPPPGSPEAVEPLPVLTAPRVRFASSAQVDAEVRSVLTPAGSEATATSLYTLDEDLLAALEPDLILTQDLCRVCSIDLASVRRIAERLPGRPRVVSLNPTTLEGVFDDVLTVGAAVGLEREAEALLVSLRQRLYAAGDFVNPYADGPVVAVLEWTDPLFIAGHWTPQLVERAGGRHPLNPTTPLREAGAAAGPIGTTLRKAGRSITIPPEALVAVRPEFLVIAPCGLDLDLTRRETAALTRAPWWNQLPAVAQGRVALVDGNQMFNRPGPRLVDAFEFLVGLLNDRPGVIPAGFPWEWWRG